MAAGPGSRCSRSPAPPASQRPGETCAGTSAPSSAASSRSSSSSPSPEARAARRSVAAASAEPPASPAATGIRLRMLQPHAAGHPSRLLLAEGARAPAAARFSCGGPGHRRADELVAPPRRPAAGSSVSSSASEIDCMTVTSSCLRVLGADRPEEQAEVDLRRARAPVARSCSQLPAERASAAEVLAARGARRGRPRGGRAPASAPRTCSR